MYGRGLVASGAVNTMPGNTLAAFADHGVVAGDTVHARYEAARENLDSLRHVGVDYADVTETLEREGMATFEARWDELGHAVARKLHAGLHRASTSGACRRLRADTAEGLPG